MEPDAGEGSRWVVLEASSVPGWVVLSCGGAPVAWRSLQGDPASGRSLVEALDDAWRQARWGRDAPPDGVAAGVGPGSYTGTRIACAAAASLAYAWGIRATPFDSLEAVALGAARAARLPVGSEVAVVRDARRGALYLGRFAVDRDGVQRIVPDRLADAAAVPPGAFLAGDAAPALWREQGASRGWSGALGESADADALVRTVSRCCANSSPATAPPVAPRMLWPTG